MGSEAEDKSNVRAALLLARAARSLGYAVFVVLLVAAWRTFTGVVDWLDDDAPFPWLWSAGLIVCPFVGLWLQALSDRTADVADEARRSYYNRRRDDEA